MKLHTFISGAMILFAGSSCSTYKSGSVSESDDRYYSLTDANKERRAASKLVSSNPNQNSFNNQNQTSLFDKRKR
jgi:flagellar basal body L-ring protein FlgH